jgi:putative SOS response-associated peptidase YedK
LLPRFPQYQFPVLAPRYNIAPTSPVLVKRNDGTSEPVLMRWGLVPSWARDIKIGKWMINARAETVAEKPSFRTALRRRRAVVFSDGYFEWRSTPAGKEAVMFRQREGEPFAFAGLWDRWYGPPDARLGQPLESVTIVTSEPNPLARLVHDRVPVILPPEAWDRWLDPEELAPVDALSYLQPLDAAEMEAHIVSRVVNKVGQDDPACVEPIAVLA